jgi:hypothetical protein
VLASGDKVRFLTSKGGDIAEDKDKELVAEFTEESEAHRKKERGELFELLEEVFLECMEEEDYHVFLCVPEVHREELLGIMTDKAKKHIKEVIPKNLTNLELDAVMRILEESRVVEGRETEE